MMLGLRTGPVRSLLCLGAHCDDVEIGAGATILRLVAENPGIRVDWIVFSSTPTREAEARACAEQFLGNAASATVQIHAFRDGFFPSEMHGIKERFEALKADVSPDVVFTHHRHDRHQDHRVVSDLTWNTFRDHLVVEYEVPKYDGDLGQPNLFVPIDDTRRRAKIDSILRHFHTQHDKAWFTADTFNALMRIRGVECRSGIGYAEAFYARKLILAR